MPRALSSVRYASATVRFSLRSQPCPARPLGSLVGTAGVEPARPEGHWILSPMRLPVPPRPPWSCLAQALDRSKPPRGGRGGWLAAGRAGEHRNGRPPGRWIAGRACRGGSSSMGRSGAVARVGERPAGGVCDRRSAATLRRRRARAGVSGAAGAPPHVQVWHASELPADWRPPACAGWDGLRFDQLVGLAGRLPSSLGAADLLARLGAISAWTGIRYWSVTRGTCRALIAAAHALTGPEGGPAAARFRAGRDGGGQGTLFLRG